MRAHGYMAGAGPDAAGMTNIVQPRTFSERRAPALAERLRLTN